MLVLLAAHCLGPGCMNPVCRKMWVLACGVRGGWEVCVGHMPCGVGGVGVARLLFCSTEGCLIVVQPGEFNTFATAVTNVPFEWRLKRHLVMMSQLS